MSTPAGAAGVSNPAPAAPISSAHPAAQLDLRESTWVQVFDLPVGSAEWLRAQWYRDLIRDRKEAQGGAA